MTARPVGTAPGRDGIAGGAVDNFGGMSVGSFIMTGLVAESGRCCGGPVGIRMAVGRLLVRGLRAGRRSGG